MQLEYTTFTDKTNEEYYVKVEGIIKPIKLIQMSGIPYVKNIESLNENIKLLHASAGGQGTSVIVDYNYTYILDMKKRSMVGFLQYDDDHGYYSKANKTPTWKLTKDFVIATSYDEDSNTFQKTKFKLSNILEIKDSDINFQKTIKKLKKAVKEKNEFSFYSSLSKKFYINRDAGGMYVKGDPSILNFKRVFPIDDKSEDNYAWEELELFVTSNIYIKESDTSLCLVQNEYYNNYKEYNDPQLCFINEENNQWKINLFEQGGE